MMFGNIIDYEIKLRNSLESNETVRSCMHDMPINILVQPTYVSRRSENMPFCLIVYTLFCYLFNSFCNNIHYRLVYSGLPSISLKINIISFCNEYHLLRQLFYDKYVNSIG